MRLEGKVAAITGAASGIGRAMAELFAREGAKVIAGDLNLQRLEDVANSIRNAGSEVRTVAVNVANVNEVNAFVDTAVSEFGRLDVLCNNAGIMDNFEPVGDIVDERWQRIMEVNVNGPMYAMRRAIPIMQRQGNGVIINTASVGGLFGGRAGAAYTASKHAVVGLTRATAWAYIPDGIRCVAIAPGAVATNIGETIREPHPLGSARTQPLMFDKMGVNVLQPEDLARTALFLASDDAKAVNGTIVTVDAGWTAG
jgi:NAD(P)-dependent dehydrogenase (short-subunit alcohol dehydrogenase family)